MIIFETNNQFIKEEDNILAPKGVPAYSISFPQCEGQYDSMVLPQFELKFIARGGVPWTCYFHLNYRGLKLSPQKGESNEMFILNVLNTLKQGDYTKKMYNIFKERMSADKFKDCELVLKTKNPKISFLEEELLRLKGEVKKLQSDDVKEKLLRVECENEELKEKINSLKKVLNN